MQEVAECGRLPLWERPAWVVVLTWPPWLESALGNHQPLPGLLSCPFLSHVPQVPLESHNSVRGLPSVTSIYLASPCFLTLLTILPNEDYTKGDKNQQDRIPPQGY